METKKGVDTVAEVKELKDDFVQDIYEMFEGGETLENVTSEVDIPKKDIVDIYESWKKKKMDNLEVGDKVCFILDIKGYNNQMVYGTVYKKLTNSVVVDCKEDEYVKKELNGRVVVSVKNILKV